MSHKINLPLSQEWSVEEETIVEQGEEVLSYYANGYDSEDPDIQYGSIELYVGNTPEDSNAREECINSYLEAIGAEEEEDIPVSPITFLENEGWYYEAQDDNECPVILICVEPKPGTLVMAILAHKDEEHLDELMTYVDEHLEID